MHISMSEKRYEIIEELENVLQFSRDENNSMRLARNIELNAIILRCGMNKLQCSGD